MRTDVHGIVFRPRAAKLYFSNSHSLAMKLSHFKGCAFITTYSIYDVDRVHEILIGQPERNRKQRIENNCPFNPNDDNYLKWILDNNELVGSNVWLICDCKFEVQARRLESLYGEIYIRMFDGLHSKVIAIEPETLFIGSQNLGNRSPLHEVVVGLKSRKAFREYLLHSFIPLWQKSTQVGRFRQPHPKEALKWMDESEL